MKKVFPLFILICFSAICNSQVVKFINLADGPVKITEPIESDKEVVIKILNRCRYNNYEIIINRITPEIPELESDPTATALRLHPTNCERLEDVYNAIIAETEESELPPLRKELNDLIKKTTSAGCAIRQDAIQLDRELDVSYNIGKLKKGEVLEITVKRVSPTSKTWAATYNTGSRGVWKTSYGFAFIPNWFEKEEKYFLNADNKITRETDLKNLDYAPAVFFNWFPGKQAFNAFSWGVSGGLGINFNVEPVVFLGGSATYNHNISINFGLVAYRQSFLKGRYKEDEIIAENNFDEESGLHQKLFRINPFIAVSFRLGKNPFKPEE